MLETKHYNWWEERSDQHIKACDAIHALTEEQEHTRRAAYIKYFRSYSNRATADLLAQNINRSFTINDKVKLNVVRSVIDTAVAHIATNRPRAMFLTEKGNYEDRAKADGLTKFIDGIFYESKVYTKDLELFSDAGVFGAGIFHVSAEDDTIKVDSIHPKEIYIDNRELEGKEGPRQIYWLKLVDRQVLIEKYPKHKDLINRSNLISQHLETTTDSPLSDMTSVLECWRLGKNGKHVVALDNVTLEAEDWGDNRKAPFVKFEWLPMKLTYFGVGIAELLLPIQDEINYLGEKIQDAMTMNSGKIALKKGDTLSSYDNKVGGIVFYSKQPPIPIVSQSISPEYFVHLNFLRNYAFEEVGVNQMQAQGVKPAGLDSGKALMVYNDIGTKRWQHTGQRWEQMHLDLAELIIDTARHASNISTIIQHDKDIEKINFNDVSLTKDKYRMKVWPTNILPETPAGKLEAIATLGQSIPQLQPFLPKLLTGTPDLDSVMSYINAPMDLAEDMIDTIIEKGVMEDPIPEMDLAYTRQLAQKAIQKCILDDISDETIEMLRIFIQKVDALANPGPPPAMMPQGVPLPLEPIGVLPGGQQTPGMGIPGLPGGPGTI